MMVTIRVRVNPDGNGEYVIYADAEDSRQPWLGQRSGAQYTGWELHKNVADWSEFELRIPPVDGNSHRQPPPRSCSDAGSIGAEVEPVRERDRVHRGSHLHVVVEEDPHRPRPGLGR